MSAVADEIGVSVASMSKYEHDIHHPGDLILLKLANYYGMTVDELMDGSEKEEGSGQHHTRMRLCPWRTKRGMDAKTGNEMTWFLPCEGKKCMAYDGDGCGMIKNKNI